MLSEGEIDATTRDGYEECGNEKVGRWLLQFRIVRWLAVKMGLVPIRFIRRISHPYTTLTKDGLQVGGTIEDEETRWFRKRKGASDD